MRFLRLELLRYGPFTDKVLKFRRDAKLHLVFGPNEAGKSSSLAAIGDLLFGFSKRKEYDFLHEAATLRVGAEIVSRSGETLDFRRRRGNKKTLLVNDSEETAMQEDALSPFLGNLSREVFSRAFGLNSDTLRQGGESMLESEGEMGAALFAAASGLTGLARVRRGLDEEADRIFAPRPSKERAFYQALERYDTAITLERQKELKSGDWKALMGEIEDTERQLAALKVGRTEVTAALARLGRLKLLEPILKGIDGISDELQGLADLPDVPEEFVAECLASLDAAEGASTQERAAAEEVEAATKGLEAVAFDQTLLDRSERIIDLFSRKEDYISKLAELPRLEAERDGLSVTLADLSQRLGFAEPEDVIRYLPPDAMVQSARELVEAGLALETAIEADEKRLAEERAIIESEEADDPHRGLTDPKPWRDQFAALAPDLKELSELTFLETSHRTMGEKLKEAGMRLVPQVTDVDLLARATLPSRDMLASFKANFERIIAERRTQSIHLETNARQYEETDRKLAEAERMGPVAYQETIRLVRADRERTFQMLRHHLLRTGRMIPPEEMASRVAQFEEESAEADGLADQAIADARRISEVANLHDRLDELVRERPEIEARIEDLEVEQERTLQAYNQLFSVAEVTPIGPDAMAAWLGSVEELLKMRREVEALGGKVGNVERLGRRLHSALLSLGRSMGMQGMEALPPPALSRLIAATLEDMSNRWTARLTLEGARQAARLSVGKIEDSLLRQRRDYKEWRYKFQILLPTLGLDSRVTAAGAAAALAVWIAVPDIIRERSNRTAKITSMRRDISAFHDGVGSLARELLPMLLELPPQGLIDVLRERAETARGVKARQDDARVRLEVAEAKLAAAKGAREVSYGALKTLASMLPEGADPRAELGRLRRRGELRRQLADRRKDFDLRAEGFGEAAVRNELPGFDRDRAAFDAEDLERQGEALHAENNRLYAQLGQRQMQRDALEAGSGSELAAFERSSAEAEIVAAARQWTVRRIAATMLSAAIEKHREAQSDPLMLRAGALFRTLSGESFSGVVQDYGEDDQPRLVGLRKSGERVPISGMSEGTRDQLYLSLRLAYIEDYASRAEPVPFIGDDIFQTFDDERTGAGVKAFASISGVVQPILFTHHLSVVAIARRALGEELDYIEL